MCQLTPLKPWNLKGPVWLQTRARPTERARRRTMAREA